MLSRRRLLRGAGGIAAAGVAAPLLSACGLGESTGATTADPGATPSPPPPSATTGAERSAPVTQVVQPHPNIAIVERFFAAYAANDLAGIQQVLAPDVVWRIPGHHPLSGEKRGVDEVLAFFAQLGKSGFRADPIFLEANDTYVVDVHRGWNTEGQGRVDQLFALSYRIVDGRIAEVQNFLSDQHAADMMFWANYPLKPLPARLADA